MTIESDLREYVENNIGERDMLLIGIRFGISKTEWEQQKTPEQKEALIKVRLERAAGQWRYYK